ncbi:MAG: bifunctional DNA-formamidopyrimidine glycosylase/DNA-(apurinic or apyrimidinic site) lyase [Anaerolineae bacterium]|nr:bifunctional DNA-formamidopyrimidine glycosylase/DNA-(apurinic or apyrimidinic site) lyase [Anaerolineae bacterium]
MPELPEVETVVRGLRAPLLGRTIQSAWLDWPNSLVFPSPEDFLTAVANQTVHRLDRRGKYILCELDSATLIIHLKMTGRLYIAPDGFTNDADRWVHFCFQLDNGHQLRFSDARKFGRVILTPDPAWVIGRLGPEPLDDAFTLEVFQSRLAGRSGVLKSLLLNQHFIAGIGNIYADEALLRAGIHPLRSADSLTDDEQARLYHSIRAALHDGIDYEGASINWYRKPDGSQGESQKHFYAYGRTGEPCQHCGTPIERIVVGQRATHYCPTCQQR